MINGFSAGYPVIIGCDGCSTEEGGFNGTWIFSVAPDCMVEVYYSRDWVETDEWDDDAENYIRELVEDFTLVKKDNKKPVFRSSDPENGIDDLSPQAVAHLKSVFEKKVIDRFLKNDPDFPYYKTYDSEGRRGRNAFVYEIVDIECDDEKLEQYDDELRRFWGKEYSREVIDSCINNMDSSLKEEYCLSSKCLPTRDELEDLVYDIDRYYCESFELPEYELMKNHLIRIQLFTNCKSENNTGDTDGTIIRLFFGNIWDDGGYGKEQIKIMKEEKKTQEMIQEFAVEYYKSRFKAVLAHEMYHAYHNRTFLECNNRYYKNINNATPGNNTIASILCESLAEYFSKAYIRRDIIRDMTEKNKVFDKELVLKYLDDTLPYFGVGRKCLLLDRYYDEESAREDYEALLDYLEQGEILIMRGFHNGYGNSDFEDAYNLFSADYYGWKPMLDLGESLIDAGKITDHGKQLLSYVKIFDCYIKERFHEALYTLLEL